MKAMLGAVLKYTSIYEYHPALLTMTGFEHNVISLSRLKIFEAQISFLLHQKNVPGNSVL
jgi:hypothetical protein